MCVLSVVMDYVSVCLCDHACLSSIVSLVCFIIPSLNISRDAKEKLSYARPSSVRCSFTPHLNVQCHSSFQSTVLTDTLLTRFLTLSTLLFWSHHRTLTGEPNVSFLCFASQIH